MGGGRKWVGEHLRKGQGEETGVEGSRRGPGRGKTFELEASKMINKNKNRDSTLSSRVRDEVDSCFLDRLTQLEEWYTCAH